MNNRDDDRLPVWWLIRAADMPRRDLVPLIRSLDLPLSMDSENGDLYTSRSAFGDFLRTASAGGR
jgi:hypothetical protein